MGDDKRSITYNDALEQLIASEAERCAGLSWLHARSETYYSVRNTAVTLPTIILSTLVGFLSGTSTSIFSDATMGAIGIGSVSLFTGVISTIGTFFSFAKKAEGHRIASIQYSKISKSLTIELTLPRMERIAAPDLLKMTRDSIERQLETSPPVPDAIVREFKVKFKNLEGIAIPEIANGIHKVSVNSRIINSPPPTGRGDPMDQSSTDLVIDVVETAQGR